MTGGNRGVGKATCIEMAKEGVKMIIIACRDENGALKTIEEI